MEKTDLWSVIEQKKEEHPPQKVTTIVKETKEILSENPEKSADEKQYVIHAYINKATNRQMYLSGWKDSSDWMISAVPFATTHQKCEKLIRKAEKQIEEANKAGAIRRRFPESLKFEIVEVNECEKHI